VLAEGIKLVRDGEASGAPPGFTQVESVDDLPFGTPDQDVTTEIDATAYLDAKLAAMRAHATQIALDGPFFAFSNNLGQQAFGREYYMLLDPADVRGGLEPRGGTREEDLFAGIG
jgi:N-acetyl-1-D-myo-inositol-2-amino-2-deoxy-alpha-D-glucopyranoside deacetylase